MRTQLIKDFPYAYNLGYSVEYQEGYSVEYQEGYSSKSQNINPFLKHKLPPSTTPRTDEQKQYYAYEFGVQDRKLDDLLNGIGKEKISTATGHQPHRFVDDTVRKLYPDFIKYLPSYEELPPQQRYAKNRERLLYPEMEYDLRKSGSWITKNMWEGIQFWFDALIVRGYRVFITGGCKGFDQEYETYIQMVMSLDSYSATYKDITITINPKQELKHIVAVPMIGQELYWTPVQQSRYKLILQQASFVYYCELQNWKVVGSKAYIERDEWMVDHSSVVHTCCLKRMLDKKMRSGTLATINYALKKGLTVVGTDTFTQNKYMRK